jgi:hypothetical protein
VRCRWDKLIELYGGDQDTARRQFTHGHTRVVSVDVLLECNEIVLTVARQVHYSLSEPQRTLVYFAVDPDRPFNRHPVAQADKTCRSERVPAFGAVQASPSRTPLSEGEGVRPQAPRCGWCHKTVT